MSETDLDDFLDGRLPEREREAFERRLGDEPELAAEHELQARLDDSLRRMFPVPTEVVPEVAPAVPRASAPPWPMLVAAGVAAALLLASLLGEHRLPPGPSVPGPTRVAAAPDLLRLPTVGPPEVCVAEGRVRPDLAEIYTSFASLESDMSCSGTDALAARLAEAYGCCADLSLKPEAELMLEGPFATDSWPTGTILTGGDETASVLVAELESNLDCCLEPSLGEDSDLHVYTWQVGELVLTEITPHTEPQLLGFFSLE